MPGQLGGSCVQNVGGALRDLGQKSGFRLDKAWRTWTVESVPGKASWDNGQFRLKIRKLGVFLELRGPTLGQVKGWMCWDPSPGEGAEPEPFPAAGIPAFICIWNVLLMAGGVKFDLFSSHGRGQSHREAAAHGICDGRSTARGVRVSICPSIRAPG